MEQARLPGGWSKRLAADTYVCGIEIGGRGQRVVVADGAGRIEGQARSIDSMAPAPDVLETVKNLIDQACHSASIGRDQIARIGVAFGGPVDVGRGLTLLSHRVPGFENFPLVNLVEDDLKIPTVMDNSARASALGEILYGAARGSNDVVYVHLGTGVGGGIIVDGRLLHGVSSTAGEFGHMVVSIGGPICSCGKPGHLEAYASAPAIVNRFRERLESVPEQEMGRWSNPNQITVKSIFDAVRRGDEIAQEIVTETVQVLGLGGGESDYDAQPVDRDHRRIGFGCGLTPDGSAQRASPSIFVSSRRTTRSIDRESAWSGCDRARSGCTRLAERANVSIQRRESKLSEFPVPV